MGLIAPPPGSPILLRVRGVLLMSSSPRSRWWDADGSAKPLPPERQRAEAAD